jgi:membrane protease YdiL (CAAX protease family)
MSSSALILVLASPLLVPAAYGVVAVFGYVTAGPDGLRIANRHGFAVYAAFVAILCALVFSTGIPTSQLAAWWHVDLGGPLVTVGAVVAGCCAGLVLYWLDHASAMVARPLSQRDGITPTVIEGATRAMALEQPSAIVACALTLIIVVGEEFLWRGVLIDGARTTWDWSAGQALALSAGAFGLHHYFFGLRNIILKTVHGAVWGGAFLITGSLIVPMMSHLVFNALAWTQAAPRPALAAGRGT